MADQIKREIATEAASGKAVTARKRSLDAEQKKGFDISALILVAVLLAAGAVLKMTVGSFVNFFGMKPNFIIAMYCLAILLVRPNLGQAAIIGLIAGAVCQLLPGTPYINFISEFLGAVAMAALIRIPMKIGRANLQTIVSTFVATVVSGGAFTICLFLFLGADASSLVAYVPIVLCTALINCVIVQALYVPLAKVLKKEAPVKAIA
ncbi:tryptophan transporter [Raoultibacter timonensis]|uniref:tryptophan transporter n=1 Tax=Raoultibacter timonensis TaxID=1907662 RepID=UPI0026DB1661|nr:tryptophan transporter [Raoultibacter timonensis]